MADSTGIEWTDATLFGAPLPKRCSRCQAIKPAKDFGRDKSRHEGLTFICVDCRYVKFVCDAPGQRERRRKAAAGNRWCGRCHKWLPAAAVTKNGQCRPCVSEYTRIHYAESESFRAARRQHASSRKRGIDPIAVRTMELLTEEFGGLCAYCDSIAESWDHLMPIAAGGTSRPFNILPACRPCNSSKGTRDALDWIEATGRRLTERFINSIALVERYG